jgi:hypothetical protein
MLSTIGAGLVDSCSASQPLPFYPEAMLDIKLAPTKMLPRTGSDAVHMLRGHNLRQGRNNFVEMQMLD